MTRWRQRLGEEQIAALLQESLAVAHRRGAIETKDLRQVPREEALVVEAGQIQELSADGAMVPLLHGTWAEARTLAIGIVGQRAGPAGPAVHA